MNVNLTQLAILLVLAVLAQRTPAAAAATAAAQRTPAAAAAV